MDRIRFIEKAKSVSKILLWQSTKETTVRIIPTLKYAVEKVLEILKDKAKEVS